MHPKRSRRPLMTSRYRNDHVGLPWRGSKGGAPAPPTEGHPAPPGSGEPRPRREKGPGAAALVDVVHPRPVDLGEPALERIQVLGDPVWSARHGVNVCPASSRAPTARSSSAARTRT